MGRPPKKETAARLSALAPGRNPAGPAGVSPAAGVVAEEESIGVAAFLARNGADDVNAYVRRRNGDTWEFVARLPGNELDETQLQRDYGGGTYEIRLQRPNGQFVGNPLRVTIAGGAKVASALPVPSTPADTGMKMLLETMALQQSVLSSLLTSIAKPATPPTIIETIAALTPLLKGQTTGGTQSVDQLDTFLRGIEFAKDAVTHAGGESSDVLSVAIDKLAVPLLAAVTAQPDKRPRTTVRATVPTPGDNKQLMPHWTDEMYVYLPLISSAAVNHRAPEDFVGPMLALLPEHVYERIAYDVKHETADGIFDTSAVRELLRRMPKLFPYQAWLLEVAAQMRVDILAAEGEDTAEGASDASE